MLRMFKLEAQTHGKQENTDNFLDIRAWNHVGIS